MYLFIYLFIFCYFFGSRISTQWFSINFCNICNINKHLFMWKKIEVLEDEVVSRAAYPWITVPAFWTRVEKAGDWCKNTFQRMSQSRQKFVIIPKLTNFIMPMRSVNVRVNNVGTIESHTNLKRILGSINHRCEKATWRAARLDNGLSVGTICPHRPWSAVCLVWMTEV